MYIYIYIWLPVLAEQMYLVIWNVQDGDDPLRCLACVFIYTTMDITMRYIYATATITVWSIWTRNYTVFVARVFKPLATKIKTRRIKSFVNGKLLCKEIGQLNTDFGRRYTNGTFNSKIKIRKCSRPNSSKRSFILILFTTTLWLV